MKTKSMCHHLTEAFLETIPSAQHHTKIKISHNQFEETGIKITPNNILVKKVFIKISCNMNLSYSVKSEATLVYSQVK